MYYCHMQNVFYFLLWFSGCWSQAMSSPEVERFEVTEDDLANEFYPRGGRRQTKNQAIYGNYIYYWYLTTSEIPKNAGPTDKYGKNQFGLEKH